jgi:flagellar L-ring protein FlgH
VKVYCRSLINQIVAILLIIIVSACDSTISRLSEVGKSPATNPVEYPQTKENYRPVAWPKNAPNQEEETVRYPKSHNSLWQPGARTFFRDQRARRVGDILKVVIKIEDKADMKNKTDQSRGAQDSAKAPKALGFERKLRNVFPKAIDPANLLDITNSNKTNGEGTIARKETIQTQIAAVVTQILPNGNLVVNGSQEIRVNYELREVTVSGIVRPEDISADNSVQSDQIAEARIIYGGRGNITNMQQPRIGTQIIDIISPF